jgi:hypothetical protein
MKDASIEDAWPMNLLEKIPNSLEDQPDTKSTNI